MSQTANHPWRVGIIGAGGIAGKIKDALAEIPRTYLVAASARTPGKAQSFLAGCKDDLGDTSRGYTNSEEMLHREHPDFVVDCSPSGLHSENILLCAQMHTNILSEKPVVMNLRQLAQTNSAVSQSRIKAGGIFQHRFLPCYQALHTALRTGRFGNLAAINISVPWYRGANYYGSGEWRGKPETDGGAVMNQGSHEVDLALWLASAAMNLEPGETPVDSLYAFTSNVAHSGIITVEDNATVSVRFRNGALGSWYFTTAANSCEENKKSVSVFGDKGSVVIRGNAIEKWDFLAQSADDAALLAASSGCSTGNAAKDPLAIAHGPHRANIEAFMAWIDGDNTFGLKLTDAGLAPVTIQSIYESARTGLSVTPPGLSELG